MDVRSRTVEPDRTAAFDYATSPLPIRDDLAEAHRRAWTWIASPGAWWTGAERVAIAEEARRAPDCPLCRERKAALSPHAVPGEHDAAGVLHAVAVDVIHRLVTDASRLSRAWLDESLACDFSEVHYVELLGVVVSIVSIDAFHRALGLPPEPLPPPLPGEPSYELPAGARPGMGWVATLDAASATGPLADLFPKAPRVPHVIRAMSLVPENVRMLSVLSAAHYVPHDLVAKVGADTGRALSRSQIELLAGRVSARNECFY